MIFGKSHVMTFDSKYYDFPAYSKPHCTYLLARDFQRGKFTVLSQQEHLIALTPDMKVKIHMNGKVESVVKTVRSGRVAKETMQDLPVQSETGFCKREGSYIVCEFNQGLRITCDQEHFLCTVELSAMDYAKSRGKNNFFSKFVILQSVNAISTGKSFKSDVEIGKCNHFISP